MEVDDGRSRRTRRSARKGKKGKPSRWMPTRLQQLYLEAFEEWLRLGKPHVQKEIAASVGLHECRISRWNRDPNFRSAVALLIKAILPVMVYQAHRGMLRLAERGNVAAYVAVMDRLERHGLLQIVERGTSMTQSGPQAAGADVGGYHVHIHGIPERRPMSELPPPMTLPAASTTNGPGDLTNGGSNAR
jgi:hypothetical protein